MKCYGSSFASVRATSGKLAGNHKVRLRSQCGGSRQLSRKLPAKRREKQSSTGGVGRVQGSQDPKRFCLCGIQQLTTFSYQKLKSLKHLSIKKNLLYVNIVLRKKDYIFQNYLVKGVALFYFLIFLAASVAYGSSQVRDPTNTTAMTTLDP